MTDIPKGWSIEPLIKHISGKSGDSKIIKGKQSSKPVPGLVQGFSASGADVWVPEAQYRGQGIVVSAVGARCGKTFQADGEWTAIANTHVLLPSRECGIDFKWLWYLTNDENFWIKSGTAQPFVKVKDTLLRPQLIPPIEEQKRIVEALDGHLSKIDKAISDLGYADSQALLFRRSLLNTLLNPQRSRSEPGIESKTRQLDWTTVPLSKLVDVLDNKRIPLSASQRKHREGSVPYYGATGQVGTIDEHLFDEPLVLLGEDGVQFFDANKPKAYKIEGPSWVNNHAHVLRPRAGLIELSYLLHFLNNFDYRGYANGTTRLKLTQGAMNSIPIHLPSIEEQKRIVKTLDDHLSRLDTSRELIASQKSFLANLRRSILNSTFTGQLFKEN